MKRTKPTAIGRPNDSHDPIYPNTPHRNHPQIEWRCRQCNRLMGAPHGSRLHISIGNRYDYFATYPVTGRCPNCGALNQITNTGEIPDGNSTEASRNTP